MGISGKNMTKSTSISGDMCSLEKNDGSQSDTAVGTLGSSGKKRHSSLGAKMVAIVGLSRKSRSASQLSQTGRHFLLLTSCLPNLSRTRCTLFVLIFLQGCVAGDRHPSWGTLETSWSSWKKNIQWFCFSVMKEIAPRQPLASGVERPFPAFLFKENLSPGFNPSPHSYSPHCWASVSRWMLSCFMMNFSLGSSSWNWPNAFFLPSQVTTTWRMIEPGSWEEYGSFIADSLASLSVPKQPGFSPHHF